MSWHLNGFNWLSSRIKTWGWALNFRWFNRYSSQFPGSPPTFPFQKMRKYYFQGQEIVHASISRNQHFEKSGNFVKSDAEEFVSRGLETTIPDFRKSVVNGAPWFWMLAPVSWGLEDITAFIWKERPISMSVISCKCGIRRFKQSRQWFKQSRQWPCQPVFINLHNLTFGVMDSTSIFEGRNFHKIPGIRSQMFFPTHSTCIINIYKQISPIQTIRTIWGASS